MKKQQPRQQPRVVMKKQEPQQQQQVRGVGVSWARGDSEDEDEVKEEVIHAPYHEWIGTVARKKQVPLAASEDEDEEEEDDEGSISPAEDVDDDDDDDDDDDEDGTSDSDVSSASSLESCEEALFIDSDAEIDQDPSFSQQRRHATLRDRTINKKKSKKSRASETITTGDVMTVIEKSPNGVTEEDICQELNINSNQLQEILLLLLKANRVELIGAGGHGSSRAYRLPTILPVLPKSNESQLLLHQFRRTQQSAPRDAVSLSVFHSAVYNHLRAQQQATLIQSQADEISQLKKQLALLQPTTTPTNIDQLSLASQVKAASSSSSSTVLSNQDRFDTSDDRNRRAAAAAASQLIRTLPSINIQLIMQFLPLVDVVIAGRSCRLWRQCSLSSFVWMYQREYFLQVSPSTKETKEFKRKSPKDESTTSSITPLQRTLQRCLSNVPLHKATQRMLEEEDDPALFSSRILTSPFWSQMNRLVLNWSHFPLNKSWMRRKDSGYAKEAQNHALQESLRSAAKQNVLTWMQSMANLTSLTTSVEHLLGMARGESMDQAVWNQSLRAISSIRLKEFKLVVNFASKAHPSQPGVIELLEVLTSSDSAIVNRLNKLSLVVGYQSYRYNQKRFTKPLASWRATNLFTRFSQLTRFSLTFLHSAFPHSLPPVIQAMGSHLQVLKLHVLYVDQIESCLSEGMPFLHTLVCTIQSKPKDKSAQKKLEKEKVRDFLASESDSSSDSSSESEPPSDVESDQSTGSNHAVSLDDSEHPTIGSSSSTTQPSTTVSSCDPSFTENERLAQLLGRLPALRTLHLTDFRIPAASLSHDPLSLLVGGHPTTGTAGGPAPQSQPTASSLDKLPDIHSKQSWSSSSAPTPITSTTTALSITPHLFPSLQSYHFRLRSTGLGTNVDTSYSDDCYLPTKLYVLLFEYRDPDATTGVTFKYLVLHPSLTRMKNEKMMNSILYHVENLAALGLKRPMDHPTTHTILGFKFKLKEHFQAAYSSIEQYLIKEGLIHDPSSTAAPSTSTVPSLPPSSSFPLLRELVLETRACEFLSGFEPLFPHWSTLYPNLETLTLACFSRCDRKHVARQQFTDRLARKQSSLHPFAWCQSNELLQLKNLKSLIINYPFTGHRFHSTLYNRHQLQHRTRAELEITDLEHLHSLLALPHLHDLSIRDAACLTRTDLEHILELKPMTQSSTTTRTTPPIVIHQKQPIAKFAYNNKKSSRRRPRVERSDDDELNDYEEDFSEMNYED